MELLARTARRRRLWICVAVVFGLLVVTTECVRHSREFQASICKVGGGGGGCQHLNASFNYVHTTFFKDHQNRPVAYILCVYDDFDPNLPRLQHTYRYDGWRGGILHIDGVPFRRTTGIPLFVNGPFGVTLRIELTQDEATDLFGRTKADDLRDFWIEFVEPRIYRANGAKVADLREGTWTFELPTGERYLEANFTHGRRDGNWTTYYPNGNIQTHKYFQNGQAAGEWEYFDESGQSLGKLEFRGGHLKDVATERGGGGTGLFASRIVSDKSGRESGVMFPGKEGGVFVLLGQRFPRYQWTPTSMPKM